MEITFERVGKSNSYNFLGDGVLMGFVLNIKKDKWEAFWLPNNGVRLESATGKTRTIAAEKLINTPGEEQKIEEVVMVERMDRRNGSSKFMPLDDAVELIKVWGGVPEKIKARILEQGRFNVPWAHYRLVSDQLQKEEMISPMLKLDLQTFATVTPRVCHSIESALRDVKESGEALVDIIILEKVIFELDEMVADKCLDGYFKHKIDDLTWGIVLQEFEGIEPK